jgi:DNA polymerase epsilon subunit 2
VSLSEDRETWDRVIILSDVFLDRVEIMERLRLIFDRYCSLNLIPSAIVLMGNFQSYDAKTPAVDLEEIKDNFVELGRLISRFPELVRRSKFILIPGPGDITPHAALPRPGIPRSIARPLLEAIPGVVLASNPCRIRYGTQELVLCRSNLQRMMRGLCILPSKHRTHLSSSIDPTSHGFQQQESVERLFDQVCATVLQEGHLCPVPLEYQPIVWEWDHAMWVYPLPSGLVLADSEPTARSQFDTCSCLNPGSLPNGSFGAWDPKENEMEICDVAAVVDMPSNTESGDEEEVEEEGSFEVGEEEEFVGDLESERVDASMRMNIHDGDGEGSDGLLAALG